MNEFKVRYVKAGVPTYIDFMTAENKTFLVTDKDETIIVDAFKVDPSNRLKFLEYVQRANIRWVLSAFWSGNPTDMGVTEPLYKFHVLESIDSTVYQNTTTIDGITTPDMSYVDSNGDTVIIPGITTPDTTYSTYKGYMAMYNAAQAASVFYSHLELPEMYVGVGNATGILFN
jgi:hypothetical protein